MRSRLCRLHVLMFKFKVSSLSFIVEFRSSDDSWDRIARSGLWKKTYEDSQ